MRVGLIGLGAIGQAVLGLIKQHAADDIEVVAVLVRDSSRPRPAQSPKVVTAVDALLAERPEVVVEAGGHAALRAYGPAILRARCDLIMVSIGALAEPGLVEELTTAARNGGVQAKMVSGAVGGLDALAAATLGGLTRVTHTTRKPATALLDPAEVARLTEAREVFRGHARQGALRFPESINVAAAVSLAGIGLDRTEVQVLADPALDRNHHEVIAEGAFGMFRFEIQSIPSEGNARTSQLAAMSVVHALLMRRAPLIVG